MSDRPIDRPELRVRVHIRNNRMDALRADSGLTVEETAERAGITKDAYYRLASLRLRAVDSKGKWNPSATRLAMFYGVLEEDLFPPVLEEIKQPSVTKELGAEDVHTLLALYAGHAESPLEVLEQKEQMLLVSGALDILSDRERRAIEDKLAGCSAEDIRIRQGNVSRERVRQVELRAIRKIQRYVALEHAKGGVFVRGGAND